MLLDDVGNSRHSRLIGEDCVLGDFELLPVSIQQPPKRLSFGFGFGGNREALLLAAPRVTPEHHEGRRTVLFTRLRILAT